jgi:drug/metabolite transporter (DMT)-like permease
MRASNIRRGALSVLAATLLFSAMGAMVKRASAELPNEMVVFFRSAISLLVLLPWIMHRGGVRILRTERLGAHLMRALFGLAAMYCFFYAIGFLPLADAVLLNYSAPLFIPFFATVVLRERVPRAIWFAILLGFVGIAMILKPGMALFTPAALIGLVSGILAAMAMVGIRGLSSSEPATRTVFYFSLVCTIVSAVPLLWAWQTPNPHLWGVLITMGACGSLAQLFLTRAYGFAPAAQVGPFTYATVVFAALLGWWFWDEVPDLLSAFGATIVCLAGVLTIRFAGVKTAPATDLPPTQSSEPR